MERRHVAPGKLRGVGNDADTVALERCVTDALGLEVAVNHRGEAGVIIDQSALTI
jgi:hypothetical protein